MESSSDFESSDFWEDFSQEHSDSSRYYSPHKNKKKIIEKNNSSYHESISTLRKSKFIEEKQVRIKEQETMRNYIQKSVERLKSRFDKELEQLKSDNSVYMSELYHNSRDFQIIFQFLIDNEVLITENRISASKCIRGPQYSHEDKRVLTKELNMVKTKIDALKRTTKIFRDDTEVSTLKLKNKRIILENMKNDEKLKEFIDIEEEIKPPVLVKPDYNEKLNQECQVQREKLQNELKELEASCENGKVLIESLQQELKMAKQVIQNPQLKNQVYPKLRDYMDDFETDEKLTISSSNFSFIKRRRVYSNKVTSNLVINVSESKPSTAPETSKFKFRSLKPTLNSSRSISKPIFFSSKRN